MKKLFVFFTTLILLYSVIFISLPENTFATLNTKAIDLLNIQDSPENDGDIDEDDKDEDVNQYFFATIKNKTDLYKSDLNTIVLSLNPSQSIFVVQEAKEQPGYYLINWQDEQLFVKAEDLNFEDDSIQVDEKKKITTYSVPSGTIIYQSTTSLEELGTIYAEQDVAVVGDVNEYFEVEIGGVIGYIKKPTSFAAKIKNGDLLSTAGKVVGKLYENNIYFTVVPTSDVTKYRITIGSNHYLIDGSSLILKGQSIKSQTSSRNDIITIKANSKIYADANLKKPIFLLSSATKTKILSISGNNYRVQVGNVVGYVPISATTGKFAAKIKYNAKIYKNTSKTSVLAINKNSGMVYTVARTTNHNLFAIVIGSKTYYVNYSDLVFTTENPKTATTTRKDAIKLKKGFVLYQNANTKTPLFSNGLQNEQFVIAGIYGQYYKVIAGNVVAYVPSKYVVITGKNREVSIGSSTPLYKIVNKKYVVIGTVSNGYSFKPTSSNSTYYFFTKDKETFAIKKNATMPTNKGVSLKAKAKASIPVTLYTERNAVVYDASGQKVGSINKGQTLALKGISKKNRAIIDFMGQQAEVAFTDLYHKDIVNGKSNISHSRMSYYLRIFALMYPEFTKLEVIGKSVEGRAIYAFRLGNGKKEILLDASFHAREHMTTNVLLEMMDTYSNAYYRNAKISSYDVRKTLNNTSIWFLPMMNPDGVMLVQQGISSVKNKSNINFVKKYARKGSYKHWKSNIRGVDLNRNFDAVRWSQMSVEKGYQNYKGPKANSEPETQAFINFANKHNFKTNISYHSSGNYIFWQGVITDNNLKRDFNLVKQIGKITGYKYEPIPKVNLYNYYKVQPRGYSTAWIRVKKQIPAMTIEIAPSQGEKPVDLKYWPSIWSKNSTVGLYAAKEAASR